MQKLTEVLHFRESFRRDNDIELRISDICLQRMKWFKLPEDGVKLLVSGAFAKPAEGLLNSFSPYVCLSVYLFVHMNQSEYRRRDFSDI